MNPVVVPFKLSEAHTFTAAQMINTTGQTPAAAILAGTSLRFVGVSGNSNNPCIDGSGSVPGYNTRHSAGSPNAPTATQVGSVLGRLACYGYGATGYNPNVSAQFRAVAGENFTDSLNGSYFEFLTTQIGTTGNVLRVTIGDTGRITAHSTEASTNTTTGAVVVAGGLGVAGAVNAGGAVSSAHATAGIGYATGAGGTVTQGTSRTTGVTINKACGEITLFSTAGSATPASFTVTNSAMAATDSVILNQKSGTDLYHLLVTAKAAGSFQITAFTTGGTTSEAPVISFAIIKGVAA